MNQAYYNEFDKFAAAWLRELIKANLIAPGEVDERSIVDVKPDDLRGFTQCHFFAGIGVWSYALRLAGWDDSRPVWTGSCPCPSFSCAGKGEGFDDPRHLWPDWVRLIRECKPPVIFGEQSDDAIGFGWLDLVQTDLEAQDYAVGKAVLASASVGGSDIRERLYYVARLDDADKGRCEIRRSEDSGRMDECDARRQTRSHFGTTTKESGHCTSGLEHSERTGLEGHAGNGYDGNEPGRLGTIEVGPTTETGASGGMADATAGGRGVLRSPSGQAGHPESGSESHANPFSDALKGFWRDADWLLCTDGKWRPVEAQSQPLVDGTDIRVGRLRDLGVPEDAIQKAISEIGFPLGTGSEGRLMRLRGYGDAINAEVAKAFIESYMEISER